MENIYINIPFLSQEQQKQYVGKHVALVDGKFVASGKTSFEAFKKPASCFLTSSPKISECCTSPRIGC